MLARDQRRGAHAARQLHDDIIDEDLYLALDPLGIIGTGLRLRLTVEGGFFEHVRHWRGLARDG